MLVEKERVAKGSVGGHEEEWSEKGKGKEGKKERRSEKKEQAQSLRASTGVILEAIRAG